MEKDQQALVIRPSADLEEARQNSPTLAGALVPGSQGAVRVWGPDARIARRNRSRRLCWAAASAAALAWALCVPATAPELILLLIGPLVALPSFTLVFLLMWDLAAKKMGPSYMSMDEAGLSFSLKAQSYDGGLTAVSRNESRCVYWNEIVALRVLASRFFHLYTSDGSMLAGTIMDYAEREKLDLLSSIQLRANLEPSQFVQIGWQEANALAVAVDMTAVRAEWNLQYRKLLGWFGACLFFTIRPLLRRPSGKALRRASRWMDRFSKLYCRPGYRVSSLKGVVRVDELSTCNEPKPLDATDPPNQSTSLELPVEAETAQTSDR